MWNWVNIIAFSGFLVISLSLACATKACSLFFNAFTIIIPSVPNTEFEIY